MVKLVTLEGKEQAEEIFSFWHLNNYKTMSTCCYKAIETHDKGVYNYMEVKPF